MKLVDFPERTAVYAKNQYEYRDLPAHKVGDTKGTIICCWKLSLVERLKLLFTGKIWHTVLTFNQPLQPQLLQTEKPEMENV